MIAYLAKTRDRAYDLISRLPVKKTWNETRGGGILTFPVEIDGKMCERKEEFKIITVVQDCYGRTFTQIIVIENEVLPELVLVADRCLRKEPTPPQTVTRASTAA